MHAVAGGISAGPPGHRPSNTATHDQTEPRSHDTIIIVLLLVVPEMSL